MYKAFILFLAILVIHVPVLAQVTMDQTFHDFGEIIRGHMRLAEFNLINNSDKKVLILRADQDPELDIRFSNKTVEPGAYATVRIQYNPRSKGRFKKAINLWISTSNEPFVLEMEGTVKELEASFQPCPTFTHPGKIQPIQFSMTLFITEMKTGKAIDGVSVQMIRNGIPLNEPLITNDQGKATKKIPLGLYYVIAEKEGYETREAAIYLNRKQNEVRIKLNPTRVKKVKEPIAIAQLVREDPPAQNSIQSSVKPISKIKEDPGDFSPEIYAANNIVFLIDVSGSMRKEGRLDLVKTAMLELVRILRPIDHVSILTYTSTSKMILESISATESNKELMVSVISGLEAKGSTVGGQAVRSAFEVVKSHYIVNGSNQVVMATDGQFRDSMKDMLRMVKKNKRGGRYISVIGIKNSARSEAQMIEISAAGSGYYINIESYADAKENLISGIKSASRKQ